MLHQFIKFPPQEGPLPIPHLVQFPSDYTESGVFCAIVPNDLPVEVGDGVYLTKKTLGNPEFKIKKIIERRPAKGDWSKQAVHKNPDYIKFSK